MKLPRGFAYVALATIVAAGCGGGSGGGTSPAPTGSDFAFGELSGRSAVTNPPITTASQTIVGTAFTGTFSSLKIRELNPSLTETRILAAGDFFGFGQGIVNYSSDGSDAQKVTPTSFIDVFPSAGANGKVVFERLLPGSAVRPAGTPIGQRPSGVTPQLVTPGINMVNLDGSGLTPMATGFLPSMDTAGDKFAYIPDSSHIAVENTSTKVGTNIPLPVNDGIYAMALSADGNTVYAVLRNTGVFTLYALPANGTGGSTTVKSFGATSIPGIACSPDGSEVAVIEDGAPEHLVRVGAFEGELSTPIDIPSGGADGVSYSPDGKRIVIGAAELGSATGLYQLFIGSSSFDRLTTDATTATEPSWMPFIKDRILIAGGGGLLGTRACGVIIGQRAIGGTTSVVAFDVTTPSSVVMTAQQTGVVSQTNLVFSIDADSIIKLAYANTANWRGIRAIGTSTPVLTANGCLVSIDGATGQVVSVLPFSGTRALGSRPTVTDNGTLRTFSGSFLAVYDKDGKNLAPSGASTVKLDTTTNQLTIG